MNNLCEERNHQPTKIDEIARLFHTFKKERKSGLKIVLMIPLCGCFHLVIRHVANNMINKIQVWIWPETKNLEISLIDRFLENYNFAKSSSLLACGLKLGRKSPL